MRDVTPVARMQPLRQAARDGNFLALKRLCKERGSNVNEPGPGSGRTALHWGAFTENNEIVSYLLNAKSAAVDPLDAELDTPLNIVIQAPLRFLQKKLAVIETLLAHGADSTIVNSRGQTPLMNLMQLRDTFSLKHYHQLKNMNAVITRMKQNIYVKAHERGQSICIYSNGQIIPGSRGYNASAAMNNSYLLQPDLSLHTHLQQIVL